MKKLILSGFLVFLCVSSSLFAQKYYTRTGKIVFSSETSLEKIEAKNTNATSILDLETGKIQFSALIKAFHFEKVLMQEHFNENYMESSKFPKATFIGKIDNFSAINFNKPGKYEAIVSGDMTIHGVKKPIKTKGSITVAEGKIAAISTFNIKVADYNIDVPTLVRDNIAEEVKVEVDINMKPFER